MEWIQFGKSLWAWKIVSEYFQALEMDLIIIKYSLDDYFNFSIRQQISIVENLLIDQSSYLYADYNDLDYKWGIVQELLTQSNENFINANSSKGSKVYKGKRPYDKGKPVHISDEQQELINEKLTPIPGFDD